MQGILAWFNTFPEIEISTVSQLSNGIIFAAALNEIDSQWFKKKKAFDSVNWVIQFNNLKRMYKLITSYFQQVVGKTIVGLTEPDCTLLARDHNEQEILKFAAIIITLSVQCERNQYFVEKIQQLDQACQTELMITIESTLSGIADNGEKIEDIEEFDGDIKSQIRLLRLENESLQKSKQTLVEKLRLLSYRDFMLAQSSGDKAHLVYREEINNLRLQVETIEAEKITLKETISKQAIKLQSFSEKIDGLSNERAEVLRFKDQVTDFTSVIDKLQRAEATIEKYKKKLAEAEEDKKAIPLLENQLAESNLKSLQLEEQFLKVAGLKPLIDTYKTQISSLEERNAKLHLENVNFTFQIKEYKEKLEISEANHERDSDKMLELQDKLKDLELSGNPIMMLGPTLNTELSDNEKNTLLQKELKSLRENRVFMTKEIERIVVLENLLEDANQLKAKFQIDYETAYTENLHLKNQLQQFQSVSPSATNEVVSQVFKTEQKLSKMRSEMDIKQKRSEMDMKQKLNKKDSVMSLGADKLIQDHRHLYARIELLENENYQLKLEIDEIKSKNLELEKLSSGLNATISVIDAQGTPDENTKSLVEATQKLNQFTEQNIQLQTALKQAREHILSQEKRIKQLSVGEQVENFVETVTNLEETLRQKEVELERALQEVQDTRTSARREQRLIMSAWYELGLQFQKRNKSQQVSWLAQQRSNLLTSTFNFPF